MWAGAAAFSLGLLSVLVFWRVFSQPDPGRFGPTIAFALLATSLLLVVCGFVAGIVALARREGVKALIGLGISLVGALPAVALVLFAVVILSMFNNMG